MRIPEVLTFIHNRLRPKDRRIIVPDGYSVVITIDGAKDGSTFIGTHGFTAEGEAFYEPPSGVRLEEVELIPLGSKSEI